MKQLPRRPVFNKDPKDPKNFEDNLSYIYEDISQALNRAIPTPHVSYTGTIPAGEPVLNVNEWRIVEVTSGGARRAYLIWYDGTDRYIWPAGAGMPTTWGDFTDGAIWVPENLDPAIMSMTSAAGGVTLTGLKANGNPISEDLFAGLMSRFRLYPETDTGLLSVKASFDSYIVPTDLLAAASNKLFLYGILIAYDFPATNSAGNSNFVFGFGRATSGTTLDFIVANYNVSNYFQTVYANSTDFTVTDGASFTLTLNFGPRTLLAGSTRSWGLLNVVLTGDHGITGETLTITASDASNPYGALPLGMKGFRVALGLWPAHNSNVGSARLTNFEIVHGFGLL